MLFLICNLAVFSQNWKPVQSADIYLYYLQGHGFDSTSVCIKADTTYTSGVDSVVVLNRALQRFSGNTFVREPNFLLEQIVYRPDGSYLCVGAHSYLFLPYQALNLSWLFDTTNNVSAAIANATTQVVFGNVDSVKTITLTTGDSIIISKNYGIIRFGDQGTYYNLAGIKGRSAGIQLPDIYSMLYTIQPGDIQEYFMRDSTYFWTNNPLYEYTRRKHTRDSLISRSLSANTITLNFTRTYVDSTWYGYTALGVTWGTTSVTRIFDIDTPNPPMEPLNNTVGLINPQWWGDTINYISYDTNTVFRCRAVAWQNLYLDVDNYNGNDTLPFIYSIPTSNGYMFMWNVFGDSIGLIYSEVYSLGDVMSGGGGTEQLTYARYGSEEYGVPLGNLNVGISETNAEENIIVFPNPTCNILHYPPSARTDHMQVKDVLGNTCLTVAGNFEGTVDVSSLSSGIYFLDFGNGTIVRFIKN